MPIQFPSIENGWMHKVLIEKWMLIESQLGRC